MLKNPALNLLQRKLKFNLFAGVHNRLNYYALKVCQIVSGCICRANYNQSLLLTNYCELGSFFAAVNSRKRLENLHQNPRLTE